MSCCRRFTYERTRPLSRDDVLNLSDAACALKMNQSDARKWLARSNLVVTIANRRRVVWGEVLDAIQVTRKREAGVATAVRKFRRTDSF